MLTRFFWNYLWREVSRPFVFTQGKCSVLQSWLTPQVNGNVKVERPRLSLMKGPGKDSFRLINCLDLELEAGAARVCLSQSSSQEFLGLFPVNATGLAWPPNHRTELTVDWNRTPSLLVSQKLSQAKESHVFWTGILLKLRMPFARN